jgi:formiminotetrahydrofolate cyclodeaminase
MQDFTQLSVNDFLDQVADKTPTPGGGGVAAAAGALACAMAKMVAGYSINKKADESARRRIEDLAVRLHRADELLRASITQDAEAYVNMTAAAKAAKDDKTRQPAHHDAILAAIAVPMEMAATASNALSAMDELKALASRYLISDLGVAAVIADACAQAAQCSVLVNLGALPDEATQTRIATDIEAVVAHCAERRGSIQAYVRDHLENSVAPGR